MLKQQTKLAPGYFEVDDQNGVWKLNKLFHLDTYSKYAENDKRGRRERDYITFPKSMAKLRSMMNTADKGLTITLPASYWYLQYFDIKYLVSLFVAERRRQLTKSRKTHLTFSTSCLTSVDGTVIAKVNARRWRPV
jgi:hypothetical protein